MDDGSTEALDIHIGSKANATYNQKKVRISGWLMLDPEHQDMINESLRSTLWEIHPITKIEVWTNEPGLTWTIRKRRDATCIEKIDRR